MRPSTYGQSLPATGERETPEWLKPRVPEPHRPLFARDPVREAEELRLAEAREAARVVGERAGLEAARQNVDAAVARYADAVERLDDVARQAATPLAREVVALALVVAGELIAREVGRDPTILLDTIEAALESVKTDQRVTVRVARRDLELLRQRRPELEPAGVTLVGDPALAAGGCVIESAQQVIDASIESRLAAVRAALVALYDDAPGAASGGTRDGA